MHCVLTQMSLCDTDQHYSGVASLGFEGAEFCSHVLISACVLVWNQSYYLEAPQATVRPHFHIVSRNNSNHPIVLDTECRMRGCLGGVGLGKGLRESGLEARMDHLLILNDGIKKSVSS